ncbi:retrovirus-related Pol polyprotein from type-1 retrotransposable element R2 [Caerostris darwini]|uniref:Retrovirus-related Pol polyprotein from type-1 retrotransposable element R2 n=1 Tax=Caerostris darwini TaxID=1538125 RepID=A0AAV4SE62_9ARAC|nr:retrovirus-related Pol polyprotein from type-1 retrotransposable element R2 [Caerostris darwini]
MKASTWIRCLQIRTDTFPTRAALLRGGRSRFPQETLIHLLSRCPALHGLIIRRHNRIVDLLVSKSIEMGWRVRKEFRCRLESGVTRVPDLNLHDGRGRAIVVDVFEKAYEEKVLKYEVRDYLKDERLGETVSIHGCRGAFPEINNQVLEDIGIERLTKPSDSPIKSRLLPNPRFAPSWPSPNGRWFGSQPARSFGLATPVLEDRLH